MKFLHTAGNEFSVSFNRLLVKKILFTLSKSVEVQHSLILSDASLHTAFGVLFCNYHMFCAVWGFNSTVTLLFYASALGKFLLLNTLWTGDADLRFYVTTGQDG
jgi:hypothetical protein